MSLTDLLTQLSEISSSLYRATFPSTDDSSFGLGFGLGFGFGSGLGLGLDIPDFLVPFPELVLDVPSCGGGCLVDRLVGVGAPLEIARELSEKHTRRVSELANQYLQNYRNSCLEIASSGSFVEETARTKMYLRLERMGRQLYKRTIVKWENDLVCAVHDRFTSRNGFSATGGRSSFNPAFAPILEAVFKENPFPSAAVKKALAAKSGMTINQIKIWFQNHRSRARKIGSDVAKSSSRQNSDRRKKSPPRTNHCPPAIIETPVAHPLDSGGTCSRAVCEVSAINCPSVFENTSRMAEPPPNESTPNSIDRNRASLHSPPTQPLSDDKRVFTLDTSHDRNSDSTSIIPDDETIINFDIEENIEHMSPLSRASSVTLVDETLDVFSYRAPYYAFPTPYPPDVDEDPFPCRTYNDYSFPKPIWHRASSSNSRRSYSMDMLELIDAFSKLTLGPPDEVAIDSRSSIASLSGFVPVYPLITPTHPAPLSSLIHCSHLSGAASPSDNVLTKHIPTWSPVLAEDI